MKTSSHRRPRTGGLWILLAVLTVTQGCEPTLSEPTVPAPSGPERGSAFLRFGRGRTPQNVPYVVDGEWAVTQGDILLGRVDQVEAESAHLRAELARSGSEDNVSALGMGVKDSFYLWNNAVMPFALDSALTSDQRTKIRAAMDHWERRTVARFTEKSVCNLFENCVTFVFSSESGKCNSHVGKLVIAGVPARQDINLGTQCTQGNITHEIGHALGLWHEHTRSDRDLYIQVIPDNFSSAPEASTCPDNFTKDSDSNKNIHGYDFGSIMHYGQKSSCSKVVGTTVQNLFEFVQAPPAGVTVGQRLGLSDGDLNAITLMYGSWVSRKYAEYLQPSTYWYVGGATTDEGRAKDWGRYRHYQNASIYWHPDVGAHVVRWEIRQKWEQLGWEHGVLGYPISDTEETAGGQKVNHFQGGSIYWHPEAGHQVMVPDGAGGSYEYPSGIRGHVEALRPVDGIGGWVYDVHSPSSSIAVHYYIDGPAGPGAVAYTGVANLPRSDVNSAFSITGNHGFQLPIPAQYYDGQQHRVFVYGIDAQGVTNPAVGGVPHFFTFNGAEGHVEQVGGSIVRGWALDLNSRSTSIAVHYYIDGPAGSGAPGFSAPTNLYRSDVNASHGATGNHGFEFSIPSQFQDGYSHSIYVYAIDAEGRHNPLLDGRSYTFQVGTPPPDPDPDPDYCDQKPWLCEPEW